MPQPENSLENSERKGHSLNPHLEADEYTKEMAKYVAITVRNAMEDFHATHLTNAQMKELNPIIRNAICSALHAYFHAEDYPNANIFVKSQMRAIPNYWEEPEIDRFLRREDGIDEEYLK